ncbi:MAG: nucleoside triphosphate pyrophosphohydrolase [Candidatus Eutrophobiaceae bacterium]
MERLIQVVEQLRNPESDCPWDRTQGMESIAPLTVKEVYELLDAIAGNRNPDILDALGNLLFHVLLHAQIASENGQFSFSDITSYLEAKLRHHYPHAFKEEPLVETENAPNEMWEQVKSQEWRGKGEGETKTTSKGLLDGVGAGFTALQSARKLQQKAAQVGFDWKLAEPVLGKVDEECLEIRVALKSGDQAAIKEEIGDLMFATVNLARHCKLDAEAVLHAANVKFTRRFEYIEHGLAMRDRTIDEATLEEMEALWTEAKGHSD